MSTSRQYDEAYYAQMEERADEELQAATERVPEPKSWGFFSYGDAPAAIGGGIGGFAWFPNRTAMHEHIARSMPFAPPAPVSIDPATVADEVETIIQKHEQGEFSSDQTLAELNCVLRRFSQIEWWGQFSELLNGNSEFAKKLRQWHREEGDQPISSEEMLRFREEIGQYGL